MPCLRAAARLRSAVDAVRSQADADAANDEARQQRRPVRRRSGAVHQQQRDSDEPIPTPSRTRTGARVEPPGDRRRHEREQRREGSAGRPGSASSRARSGGTESGKGTENIADDRKGDDLRAGERRHGRAEVEHRRSHSRSARTKATRNTTPAASSRPRARSTSPSRFRAAWLAPGRRARPST